MRTSRFSREHLRDLQRHRAPHSGRLGTNVAQEQVPSERSCSGDLRGAVAGGDQSEPSHCATANAGVERPRIRPRHRGVEEEKRTSRARNSCPLRFAYQSSRTGKDHQSHNGERAVDLLRSGRRWALASPFGKSSLVKDEHSLLGASSRFHPSSGTGGSMYLCASAISTTTGHCAGTCVASWSYGLIQLPSIRFGTVRGISGNTSWEPRSRSRARSYRAVNTANVAGSGSL